MDIKTAFAQNLKYYMKKNGINRQQICIDLGMKYSTFSNWCQARKLPNYDKAKRIADYLSVSSEDLFKGADITSYFCSPASRKKERKSEKVTVKNKSPKLSAEMNQIISQIESLNEDGVMKLKERLNEIILIPKYRKKGI